MFPRTHRSSSFLLSWLVLPCIVMSCGRAPDATLYVALDQQHSESIVAQFEERTGLDVNPRFDTEASKTVGLVSAIIEEASRPRCDVFWNNELAQTVRLAQKGLLEPYDSPSARDIPEQWKDKGRRWAGFGARARIFIVNKTLIPDPKDWPKSMWDLVDPKWKGRCGLARPLTGTTLTHFAALSHVLGEQEFNRFLDGIRDNECVLVQSNGATMRAVRDGQLAFAFTDTDDFHVALLKGHPVGAVFPDAGAGEVGTMLIPNSVALVKGGPNPAAGRRLIDFILSQEVEALLAASAAAQIPLRESVPGPASPDILPVGRFRAMAWDPEKTAASLEQVSARMQERFGQ